MKHKRLVTLVFSFILPISLALPLGAGNILQEPDGMVFGDSAFTFTSITPNQLSIKERKSTLSEAINKSETTGFVIDSKVHSSSFAVFSSLTEFDEPKARAIGLASYEQVDLLWPEIEDPIRLTVTRNDEIIYEGKYLDSFSDKSVASGSEYFYEASVGAFIPEDRFQEFLSPEELEEIEEGANLRPQWEFAWGINVSTPKSQTNLSATEAISAIASKQAPKKTSIRYRTAIKDQWVPAPGWGPGAPCSPMGPSNYRFAGDNVTELVGTGGKYRTSATVVITWSALAYSFNKGVGSTKLYKKTNGVWSHLETKTASTNGIEQTMVSRDKSKAHVRMNTKVLHPFCNKLLVHPITAIFNISILKAGNYSIFESTRRPVPNHAVFIRRDSGTWKRVRNLGNSSFDCLSILTKPLPLCSMKNIGKSGVY